MLCLKCPKRENCSELCPKAEKYASQDYRSQRERTYTPISLKDEEYSDLENIAHKSSLSLADLVGRFSGEINFSFLTRRQNRILTLFYSGLPYWKIARNLKINKRKVSNELYTAKRKIKEFVTKEKGIL